MDSEVYYICSSHVWFLIEFLFFSFLFPPWENFEFEFFVSCSCLCVCVWACGGVFDTIFFSLIFFVVFFFVDFTFRFVLLLCLSRNPIYYFKISRRLIHFINNECEETTTLTKNANTRTLPHPHTHRMYKNK